MKKKESTDLEVIERLFENSIKSQRNKLERERARHMQENQLLKPKPTISPESKRLASKKIWNSSSHERLFEDSIKRRQTKRQMAQTKLMEDLEREEEEQEEIQKNKIHSSHLRVEWKQFEAKLMLRTMNWSRLRTHSGDKQPEEYRGRVVRQHILERNILSCGNQKNASSERFEEQLALTKRISE